MPENQSARADKRRDAFLAVATRLFLAKGFDGVSVNEIVREAGGSLATLYNFFPTKRDLFRAIAKQDAVRLTSGHLPEEHDSGCIRESLTRAALALVAQISSPEHRAIQRTVILSVPRFKDEARVFFLERRMPVVNDFKEYLGRQCARGHLHIDDLDFAARQLLAVVTGTWVVEAIFGGDVVIAKPHLCKTVREGITTFLTRFGKKYTCLAAQCELCPVSRADTLKPPPTLQSRLSSPHVQAKNSKR